MQPAQKHALLLDFSPDNIKKKKFTDYVETGNKRGSRGESATARFLAGGLMNDAEGLPNGTERD